MEVWRFTCVTCDTRYCDVVAVAINNCSRHVTRPSYDANSSSSSAASSSITGTSSGAQTPNPGRVAPRHPSVDAVVGAAAGVVVVVVEVVVVEVVMVEVEVVVAATSHAAVAGKGKRPM
jgi:hypothetical protein